MTFTVLFQSWRVAKLAGKMKTGGFVRLPINRNDVMYIGSQQSVHWVRWRKLSVRCYGNAL